MAKRPVNKEQRVKMKRKVAANKSVKRRAAKRRRSPKSKPENVVGKTDKTLDDLLRLPGGALASRSNDEPDRIFLRYGQTSNEGHERCWIKTDGGGDDV